MSYTHLTLDERFKIAHMHMAKFSTRLIAQRINRSPSTISREVRRNKGSHSPYWYDWAQQYADERKAQPTCEKRKSHQPLYALVANNIEAGLSPEIISGRLKREFRSPKMRVSHETIYRWVIADALEGGVLYLSLVRHHKRRRKQRRSIRKREFSGRVSISERPNGIMGSASLISIVFTLSISAMHTKLCGS